MRRNPPLPPPFQYQWGKDRDRRLYLISIQIRMYKGHGMTFSTLMWKSKTKIMECVISGAAHKGMTPIKKIPHSGAMHHPFRVSLKIIGIAEVFCRRTDSHWLYCSLQDSNKLDVVLDISPQFNENSKWIFNLTVFVWTYIYSINLLFSMEPDPPDKMVGLSLPLRFVGSRMTYTNKIRTS